MKHFQIHRTSGPLLALALLVAGLSGCSPGQALLKCDTPQVIVEHDSTAKSSKRVIEVVVRNPGTIDVVIDKIETGCSCTMPNVPDHCVVLAGKNYSIPLELDIPEYEDRNITVSIHSNATPPQLDIGLTLRCGKPELPKLFSMERQIEIRGRSPGEYDTEALVVEALERSDQKHWIKSFESDLPAVVQQSGAATVKDQPFGQGVVIRRYVFPLIVLTADSGSHTAILSPQFSASPNDKMQVHCVVEYAPAIAAIPSVIRLRADDNIASVTLLSAEDAPFQITSAKFLRSCQWKIAFDPSRSQATQVITLSLTDSEPQTTRELNEDTELLIETTLKEYPNLRIPVLWSRETHDCGLAPVDRFGSTVAAQPEKGALVSEHDGVAHASHWMSGLQNSNWGGCKGVRNRLWPNHQGND